MSADVPIRDLTSEGADAGWHTLAADDVLHRLGSDATYGLTSEEAGRRLAVSGPNRVFEAERESSYRILVRQFTSFLVVLLIVAALVSGSVLGEWVDAAAILTIVVLNAVIGFVQESRAASAMAALTALTVPAARVLRGGAVSSLDGTEVVPGDVIVLEAGDKIPADARLLEIVRLEVDESALTGESLPVEKQLDPVARSVPIGDRLSMVFAGTTVSRGRARAVVTTTGKSTEVGRIAAMTSTKEPPTPLQVELDAVGRRLALVSIAAAVLVVLIGMGRGLRMETMLLTGVALAVAVIPEGLPTVVAVTLARGVQRMARRNAIVRQLYAVEALGAAGVICTDKTGTLTENRLRVRRTELADGMDLEEAVRRGDARAGTAIAVMTECTDATLDANGWAGSAVDVALIDAAAQLAGHDPDRDLRRTRRAETPFESARRMMAVVVEDGDRLLELVKGAPEFVVEQSHYVATDSGTEPMTPAWRDRILRQAVAAAEDGLRTLALAYAERPTVPVEPGAGDGFVYVATLGLADSERPAVPGAVRTAQRAGIKVVMVTGDHPVTARAVGRSVGIVGDEDEVMTGVELHTVDQTHLNQTIDRYRAFSRVDPADKVKIVHAWQSAGHVVAMTGDGVNDGPALRASDIGVAMGTGTDVAKEASSLVLADDDFATIVHAVDEGRKIFSNLRNVIHYLLSANASEVFTMLVGVAFFGSLGEPLRAVQLLWINLVSDGLPALALGVAVPDRDVMDDPPGKGRDVLGRRNLALLGTQGAVLAAGAIGALIGGAYVLGLSWRETQTMVFTTMVVSQLLHAFNLRERLRGLRAGAALLLGAVLLSLVAHLLILWLPVTQDAFKVVAMSWGAWVWTLVMAIVAAAGARAVRRLFG